MPPAVRTTTRHAPDAPRGALLAVLGDPALAWVRHQVLARLEDDGDGGVTGVLQLLTATPAQRSAAAGLLGPGVVRGTRVSVRVEDVEQLLVEVVGWDHGLAAAVRLLEEPPAAPAAPAATSPLVVTAPGPAPAPARVVLPETRSVPLEAPAPAPAPAAPVLPPAATLAPPAPPAPALPAPQHPAPASPAPRRAAAVRELDRAGADAAGLELVDVVMVLGLPVDHPDVPGTGDPASSWRPALLTLHGLRSAPPTWHPAPAGGTVWVCATPSVLAAVAAGAPSGRPAPVVVCLDALAASTSSDPAWPGEAVGLVLDGLRAAGWQLRLNGGDGPEGPVLTELLAAELEALPWRTPDADPALADGDPLAAAAPGTPLLEQLLADVRRAT